MIRRKIGQIMPRKQKPKQAVGDNICWPGHMVAIQQVSLGQSWISRTEITLIKLFTSHTQANPLLSALKYLYTCFCNEFAKLPFEFAKS